MKLGFKKFTSWISSPFAQTQKNAEGQQDQGTKGSTTTTEPTSRPLSQKISIDASKLSFDASSLRKAKGLASRTSSHLRDFSFSSNRKSSSGSSKPVISAPTDFRRTSGLSSLSVLQQDDPSTSQEQRLELSIHQPENRLLDLATVLNDFDRGVVPQQQQSSSLRGQSFLSRPLSVSSAGARGDGFDHFRFPRKPVGSGPKRSSLHLSQKSSSTNDTNPLIPHFSTRGARPGSAVTHGSVDEQQRQQQIPSSDFFLRLASAATQSTDFAEAAAASSEPIPKSSHRWLITDPSSSRKSSFSSPEYAVATDWTTDSHYRLRPLSGSTLFPSFTNIEFGDGMKDSNNSTATDEQTSPWVGVHVLA